jgi:hypothetical protein
MYRYVCYIQTVITYSISYAAVCNTVCMYSMICVLSVHIYICCMYCICFICMVCMHTVSYILYTSYIMYILYEYDDIHTYCTYIQYTYNTYCMYTVCTVYSFLEVLLLDPSFITYYIKLYLATKFAYTYIFIII